MKCEKCGGNIERVAYNCDIGEIDVWDCMCEKCGHVILEFPAECNCGGLLELVGYNDFIESSDGFRVGVFSCEKCLKEYLREIPAIEDV
ncbi:MAG: hypothetical protein E7C49_01050 [Clostridium sp.]|nr:hypothetical protein [Clostridium sp.]